MASLGHLRERLDNFARVLRQAGQRGSLRVGRFATARPLSTQFGYDRGTPIDRLYIESFLESCSRDIRGRGLEIGDDSYSRRFGGSAITRQDILHVHAGNPIATMAGDISDPTVLPSGAFDCIVLTQTVHLIYDMPAAVREVYRALRPGGVALITVPGITPVDRGEWGATWYWSLTPAALQRLLGDVFGGGNLTGFDYGNLYAATAFLHGAALHEVDAGKLTAYDPAYPMIVAARARKLD